VFTASHRVIHTSHSFRADPGRPRLRRRGARVCTGRHRGRVEGCVHFQLRPVHRVAVRVTAGVHASLGVRGRGPRRRRSAEAIGGQSETEWACHRGLDPRTQCHAAGVPFPLRIRRWPCPMS